MKVDYPKTATDDFKALCTLISMKADPAWGPQVAETMAAQLALESGWGTSQLAIKHNNYAGMKWRDIMTPWAVPVKYMAHDGRERYCHFGSLLTFFEGFIARLDKLGPYDGWREAAAKGGAEYINFVGPIWLGMKPHDNQEYVQKVLALVDTRFS